METESTEQEKEKFFALYGKLISGSKWKQIATEAGYSRQWFDKKRTEYKLPPPTEVRRARKEKEHPKQTREQILKRRKLTNWLTMSEAAERLGITSGVLAVQQRKGKIKGDKEGVYIFFHKDEVERYKKNHRRNQEQPNDSYMTVQEVVESSEKSPATVYADIAKGKLDSWKSGVSIFVPRSAYQHWLDNKKEKTDSIDQSEIMQSYRALIEGADWESLEISKKISYKGFDKRRSALKLPPVSEMRKKKELVFA